MKISTKLYKDIENAKKKLQKTKFLYENFGQKEIRKIKDKYFLWDLDLSSDERNYCFNLISQFENWCGDYC